MIAKHADVVDGVFLQAPIHFSSQLSLSDQRLLLPSRYCEVGVRSNGTVYLPADGAVATCSDAVAALRAVKRPAGAQPLTVQGVISLIKCPGVEQNPAIFIETAAAFADEFNFDGISLDWEACPYACDAKPIVG